MGDSAVVFLPLHIEMYADPADKVPFYRGLGYTVFGPEEVTAAAGGGTFPGYWFQKK